jgi:hypothetical protein
MKVTTKTCSACGVIKPEDQYDLRSDRPTKRRAYCKDCRRAKVREYDARNRERKATCNREYKKANRQKISDKNKIRYRKKKGTLLAYVKKWRMNNPHKVAEHRLKRQEALQNSQPDWLSQEHLLQIKYIYQQAKDCSVTTGETYEVDHIVPLRGKGVCGLHVPWNLQILPRDLNRSKSNHYE